MTIQKVFPLQSGLQFKGCGFWQNLASRLSLCAFVVLCTTDNGMMGVSSLRTEAEELRWSEAISHAG